APTDVRQQDTQQRIYGIRPRKFPQPTRRGGVLGQHLVEPAPEGIDDRERRSLARQRRNVSFLNRRLPGNAHVVHLVIDLVQSSKLASPAEGASALLDEGRVVEAVSQTGLLEGSARELLGKPLGGVAADQRVQDEPA